MTNKIILEWGRPGQIQPPNAKEIKNTLKNIKDKARKSNVFQLSGISSGMLEYLKEHLDPSNAVVKVVMEPESPTGGYWIIIGTDEKTVDIEMSRI